MESSDYIKLSVLSPKTALKIGKIGLLKTTLALLVTVAVLGHIHEFYPHVRYCEKINSSTREL
jgi:hypothetical protein